MRKTVETMNMSKETELFNNAIDYFFGMNPAKRHWILLALYLAKNKKLTVIDNYAGDGFVMAQLDFDLVEISNPQKAEDWKQKGIHYRSIVATVVGEERVFIEDIYNSFDQNRPDDPNMGFFGKRRMEPDYLIGIAKNLISLSDEWYRQNTKWAIDSIMKKMIDYDHLVREFYQPKELTELALMLLDAHEGTVYNPYAGVCSYGAGLNSSCQYYGQEISNWSVVGKLIQFINSKTNTVVRQEDSVSDWRGENFDYIVATPPFNIKCDSKYRYSDFDFLARSSEDAKKKAIGIFRSGICFSARNDKNSPIVELVEKDWLEYVISLPQGLFATTAISSVMLVINKSKTNKGVVRFVDASDCFEKTGKKSILSTTDVINLLKNTQPGKSADINIADIKENKYIIAPAYYLSITKIEIPTGFELHTLSEYIRSVATKMIDEGDYRVLSSSLSNNVSSNGIIYAKDLEKKRLDKSYQTVNCNCLILNRSEILRSYFLISDNERVAIPSFYIPFDVDSTHLDPQYLLIEMQKDYFVSQVRRYGKTGSVVSTLRFNDFLELKILVPSLTEQRSIVEASNHSAKLALIEKLHLQEEIEKMKMDYMDEVRSRKHDMKSHICQLTSAIKNIEYDLVHKNDKDVFSSEKEWLDDMMEEVRNQTLAIKHLNTILDIFSREDKFGTPEIINIGKFLSENIVKGERYKVEHVIDYDALKDYGFDVPEKESNHEFLKGLIKVKLKYEIEDEDIEDANVFVAKDDLLRLFDNIINNAVSHGFTENRDDYCIRTNLTVNPQLNMFQIDITNNGTPLPIGLDKHRYGIKGEMAGRTGKTGEGGYIVKSIVEHYEGDYDIFTEEKGKKALTTVRILLPIHRTYGN